MFSNLTRTKVGKILGGGGEKERGGGQGDKKKKKKHSILRQNFSKSGK